MCKHMLHNVLKMWKIESSQHNIHLQKYFLISFLSFHSIVSMLDIFYNKKNISFNTDVGNSVGIVISQIKCVQHT